MDFGKIISDASKAYETGENFNLLKTDKLEVLKALGALGKRVEDPAFLQRLEKVKNSYKQGRYDWISDGYLVYLLARGFEAADKAASAKEAEVYFNLLGGTE
jgi:hypothetical protein